MNVAFRRGRSRRAPVAAVFAGLLCFAQPAAAQCPASDSRGNCNFVVTLLRLPTLNRLTTSATSLSLAPTGGGITAADMTLGYVAAASALTVTVETNAASNTLTSPTVAPTVRLRWLADAAAWSGSGCPFSVSDLTYSSTVNGTYVAVPTTATVLLSGLSGATALAGRQVTLYFRTRVAWSDAPAASCTLPLVFTVEP